MNANKKQNSVLVFLKNLIYPKKEMVYSFATNVGVIEHKFRDYRTYMSTALKNISAVYKSCDIIANYVEASEWQIYDSAGKPISKNNVNANKFLSLLEMPNKQQTLLAFKSRWVFDMLLTGNSFWLLDEVDGRNRPSSIFRLNPSLISVVRNPKTLVSFYVYNLPGRRLEIPAEFVIHSIYNPDPCDEFFGMGLIEANEKLYESTIQLYDFRKNFIKNGAVPSGILSTEQIIPEITYNQMKEKWKAEYSGEKNSGKVPILTGGMKYQQIGLSLTQLEDLKAREFSMQEIFMLFGVPPILTGLNPEKIKYDNAFEQRKIFMEGTIAPLLKNFDEAFNLYVVPKFFDGYLKHNDVTVRKTTEEVISLFKSGIISLNESRVESGYARVLGKPEFDEHYMPINTMPLSVLSGLSNPALTAPGGKPENANLTFLPNGKPREKSWRDYHGGGWKVAPAGGVWSARELSDNDVIAKLQLDFLRISRQSQLYKINLGVNIYESFLIAQEERVLKNYKEKYNLKATSNSDAEKIVKEIFVISEEDRLLKAQTTGLYQSNVTKAVDDYSTILTFEIDEEERLAEIAKQVELAREKGVVINKTTRDKLQRIIADGIESQKTQSEIALDIQKQLRDFNTARPLTIARNEIGEAYRRGARISLEKSKVVKTISVIGCEEREPGSPTYRGESTCNISGVPISDIGQLEYHVNHTGAEVPESFG